MQSLTMLQNMTSEELARHVELNQGVYGKVAELLAERLFVALKEESKIVVNSVLVQEAVEAARNLVNNYDELVKRNN